MVDASLLVPRRGCFSQELQPHPRLRRRVQQLVLYIKDMENFVIVTKPSAIADEQAQGSRKPKKSFKYNPYPVPKAKERQIEAWRDRKRIEKYV